LKFNSRFETRNRNTKRISAENPAEKTLQSEKYRELRILSENNLNFRMFSLLLLPLLLLSTGCTETDGELRAGFEAGRYRTVVAFGDSIVEGYKQPEGWPEILGRDAGILPEGTAACPS
jgi:hypothetical protein